MGETGRWLDALLTSLGIEKGTLAAAFVGALISMKFLEGLAVWQRWLTALAGWATALFITPGVIRFFQLEVAGWAGSIGFIVGVFGMAIIGAVFKAIQDVYAVDWGEMLKSWFARRGGGQ